jgi:hypothetical protein
MAWWSARLCSIVPACVPMSFGPGSCPSLGANPVAYVRRDTYDRRGRIACAAVPAPPVYDAALEVTMCPLVHSFWTSGEVAATVEA